MFEITLDAVEVVDDVVDNDNEGDADLDVDVDLDARSSCGNEFTVLLSVDRV